MTSASYTSMDDALAMLADRGPDLRNGMTSHAPMAAEALSALGRADAVLPWVERYRAGMLPWPKVGERIDGDSWQAALGREARVADWRAFFREELEEAAWPEVVERWTARLAPGFSAAATHGVLRVGHAVRSLAESPSRLRREELADAFASWASTYQELPVSKGRAVVGAEPWLAIERVQRVPLEQRRFSGTITSALAALGEFAPFGPVIGYLDVGVAGPMLVAELTDIFARVYLANARDGLTSIVFVHGVTSVAAVGHLLPYLAPETASSAVRYAWQSSCALYATFGSAPPVVEVEETSDGDDELIARAVEHGEEHAIKFTEACLDQHRRRPSPAYRAAVRDALERLPRP